MVVVDWDGDDDGNDDDDSPSEVCLFIFILLDSLFLSVVSSCIYPFLSLLLVVTLIP